MNLLASWITSPINPGSAVMLFRRTFVVEKEIKKASLCVSAFGIYTAVCNGHKIGPGVLEPGWTSAYDRVLYQDYDVSDLLRKENILTLGVGRGWGAGTLGWTYSRELMDSIPQPSVIAWLEITFVDGSVQCITTNTEWEVYSSQTSFAEIYNGETIDRTKDETLIGAACLNEIAAKLVPQNGEWIMEHERFAPSALIHTPKGETVLDFGQNMTGYVEIKIRGERGSRIVLHHAEVLDSAGNFYVDNYRTAKNEMTYILSGGDDVFKPEYSFQGFRYVRLTEFPEKCVDLSCFRAIAVYSDLKRTGWFVCGNNNINQLYHNIIWGQKSNYLDIPTDCPQRDERLGWTGDAQVFCRTAAINFDVERFFDKWLEDMALEQHEDGAVSGIVPDCFRNRTDIKTRISAAWGDAACIIPWEMYMAYGDTMRLRKFFPMMKKWVDYIHSAGPEEYLWLGGMHYGDWLAMDAGSGSYVGATSNDLIASAFFAHSTDLLIRAGEVLGEDMSEYRLLHEKVIRAFRAYFMENGMPREKFPYTEICLNGEEPVDTVRQGLTQTALTLILHFNLCTEEEKPALAAALADMIRARDKHLATGFVGTPYLLHVLSDTGYTELAFDLLFQETAPSWLYSVLHGATTMWEHWDSIREDGTFWSSEMNSFNHYAYGAVFDWIFGVAAGICPSRPGYQAISIQPHPDRRLGFIDTTLNTRNGTVRVHWYYKNEKVCYELEIPAGITAYLRLPTGYEETLTGGIYCYA